MIVLSAAVTAALEKEAFEILLRIAESPAAENIAKQFEARLSHLAERLGSEALERVKAKITAALAEKPAS